VGYLRLKWAKEPAIGPERPLKSLRRRVELARDLKIGDPRTFDEHFFNGLLGSTN
jgi:hypothetical protein